MGRKTLVSLPESTPSSFRKVDLPKADNWLIVSDLHVPFHDNGALEVIFDWATSRNYKIDGVLFLGDVLDCYQLSDFVKDPTQIDFKKECELGAELFSAFEKILKPKVMVWKEGNHEQRLIRYFMTKAPALFQCDPSAISVKKLTSFSGQYIPTQQMLRHKDLHLIHGHEFTRGFTTPVNIARGTYMKLKACAIQGHHHKSDSHSERTADDNIIQTWSLGCLCDLHPAYMPINNWGHGFAVLHTTGKWRINQYRIINGTVS